MKYGHQNIYAGISVYIPTESESQVAIALRDETYLLDFKKAVSRGVSDFCGATVLLPLV
jgi:hypothetical protein